MNEMIKTKRKIWSLIIFGNLLIILFFWWQGSASLIFKGLYPFLSSLGRLGGLLAVYTVLLQFFFAGRNPWLEKVFGLDKLFQYHQLNGKLSLLFLLLHPIFLTIGYAGLTGTSWFNQTITFLFKYDDLASGYVSLLLFLLVVVSSLYIFRKRLAYENWYLVHLAVYIAVFMALGHQFELGRTLNSNIIFYGYWILLCLAVLINHAFYRILQPAYNYYKHRFKIERIVQENHNCTSIYISGSKISDFKYRAGQFVLVRFLTKDFWWQSHPFSLSKLPDGKTLRITIKKLGDFTSKLEKLQPGNSLILEGPFGVFTDFFAVSNKILLIAGGIGITPIRAIAEKFLQMGKDVILLYSVKEQKDLIFIKELEELKKFQNFKLVNIFSQQTVAGGLSGRISKEVLQSQAPDIKDREVYICGPILMLEKIIDSAKSLGVKKGNLHYEKFVF